MSATRIAVKVHRSCGHRSLRSGDEHWAWSTGWGWDCQEAEIEFRKAGGTLDGMMGVVHYASMLYPAPATMSCGRSSRHW
jgi:hypothetical protein